MSLRVVRAVRAEVGEYGERFDGLTEPHLVADDDLALHEREPSREALISAQGDGKVLGVKLQLADSGDDFIG